MMLRTRLTLMVSLCFIAITAIVAFEGRLRQGEAEQRYEAAQIAGHRNAWTGAINAEMRGLRDEIGALSNNDVVVQAVAGPVAGAGDGPVATDPTPFLDDLLARMRLRVPGVELEVVRSDGSMVFTSHPGPARFLSKARVDRVLGTPDGLSGLVGTANGRDVLVAIGVPVFTRAGAAGVVALTVDASILLPELRGATSSSVFLLSPMGVSIEAEGEDTWPGSPADAASTPSVGGLIHIFHKGRVLESSLLPLKDIDGNRLAVLAAARDITDAWRRSMLLSSLSYAVVLTELALFLAALYWYLRKSFRPLNAAIRVLNALSRGDTSVAGPSDTGRDEIGRLARTMENFRKDQELLAETSAAKERIESELSVARDIQSHIVPTVFTFPDHNEFDLHAVMEPAKAVGGDLYDFFLLDERHLFFLIGDVSDKGVPSALFMAIAKALFKNVAQSPGVALSEVMGRVNRQLTLDNPSQMFVTVFACLLDLETGVVTYSDGGHELPLRLKANGKAEILKKEGGLALGFMDDYVYRTAEIALAPGDALVLYTDGVNEAMNLKHEMFKVDRIPETLQGAMATNGSAAEIARTLLGAVHRHAGEAPQSDDITIVAVRWRGPRSLFLAADARDAALVVNAPERVVA